MTEFTFGMFVGALWVLAIALCWRQAMEDRR